MTYVFKEGKNMKTSKMNELDLILEIEGGQLIISDYEDWNRVKELARDWSRSQGFYGRLLRDMIDFENNNDELPFPIYL